MLKVDINNLKIFGYHGCFDVEKIHGQFFNINISYLLSDKVENNDTRKTFLRGGIGIHSRLKAPAPFVNFFRVFTPAEKMDDPGSEEGEEQSGIEKPSPYVRKRNRHPLHYMPLSKIVRFVSVQGALQNLSKELTEWVKDWQIMM